MTTVLRILVVAALQTAALAYMIVDRQMMLNASQVVTLKVVPIDPRDIFRGDYVILNYEISNVDPSKLQGDDRFTWGDTIFVTVVPQGAVWSAAAVGRDRPVAVDGGVAIRGTINRIDEGERETRSLGVTYGIESYFVPQGTGMEIENEARRGELSIDVAVGGDGRAAIKAIRRNGQPPFYVEGLF